MSKVKVISLGPRIELFLFFLFFYLNCRNIQLLRNIMSQSGCLRILNFKYIFNYWTNDVNDDVGQCYGVLILHSIICTSIYWCEFMESYVHNHTKMIVYSIIFFHFYDITCLKIYFQFRMSSHQKSIKLCR